MGVHFVIGRAGTGKTRRCFDAIARALAADPLGPPIYWIVPRQATFAAERELTCSSGLGGFCRARVLSFDALAEHVLRACGGEAVPEVTPLGRLMILGHLLRDAQPRLRYFHSVARLPGLAAKLDATFADLERAGRGSADLAALQDSLGRGAGDGNPSLRDKVHDLRLIYEAYDAYLGQDRLDPHRRLAQVLSCLQESQPFAGAAVYVDGFWAFSEFERRVIARLGKVCRMVEVTLPIDPRSPVLSAPDLYPDEASLFHPVELTYRRLWHVLAGEGTLVDAPPTLLGEPHRFRVPSLAAVERDLFGHVTLHVQREAVGIDLVEAPDRRAEVDAAARKIRELTTGDGALRLRDVAVIVRDLAAYHELIDASFGEHGIRYFVDRRRPVAHHPLPQFARALLLIARDGWPHEQVMSLLKTGLTGLTDDEGDELENYVLAHRVRGEQWAAPEPWSFARTIPRDADDVGPAAAAPERIDALRRRLSDVLGPFVRRTRKGASTVRAIAGEVFAVLEAFKARRTLVGWMSEAADRGDLEQRGEHEQAWAELVNLFEQMIALLGDEPLKLRGFVEVFEAGLEQFDLALAPPTVDEVLVGQADRTRPPGDLRAVLVLGLTDGEFPRSPHEDSVLSDTDRRELKRRDLDVDPPADRRLLDEALLGYHAFAAASEHLYASRPLGDAKGRALAPSPYWLRLRRMFPSVATRQAARYARSDPAAIATPRQLLTGLMRWARHAPPAGEPGPWPALYEWLRTAAPEGSVSRLRDLAWPALAYENVAWLRKDVAAALFHNPLRASVGQIESFAACPFQHFLRYGLALEPRPDEDVTALDMSGVYHHVLQQVVREMLREHKTWADLPEAERAALVRAAAQQIARTLRGEVLMSNARNRYFLARIERTLARVLAHQAAAAGRGGFRPGHAAVRFGPGGQLPELDVPTPDGRSARLRGTIDRVDVLAGGVEVAIVDYRLGGQSLALDHVYHGLSLQLLTYLLVLQEHGQALAGRALTPVAALYVQMLRKLKKVAHPDEATPPDHRRYDLDARQRGIFDGRFLAALDANLADGWSDVVSAFVSKGGGFGHRGSSDVADAPEFAALLAHVRLRLGQLAGEILDGKVDVAPYWINEATPCPRCEHRPVCRFEVGAGAYRVLAGMSRTVVLAQLTGRGQPGGGDGGQ